MKKLVLAICLACMLALNGAAHSAPAYYEGFDYPAGDLTSSHGWQNVILPFIIVAPGGTYSDGTDELVVTGNAASYFADGVSVDQIVDRDFPAGFTDLFANYGTFYITALIKQSCSIWFLDYVTQATRVKFSVEPWYHGDGMYSVHLELYESGVYLDMTVMAGVITDSDYHLYALRVINQAGADDITLLIDPNLSDPGWDTPSLAFRLHLDTVDITTSDYNELHLFNAAQSISYARAYKWIGGVDEIRVASTWEEAAPRVALPKNGTLSGVVTLLDFAQASSPVAVKVQLIQNSVVVRSDTVMLESNGAYSIYDVAPGTYDVAFGAASWLSGIVEDVELPDDGSGAVCNISLTNGTVDGDNDLDGADRSIVISNLDKTGDQ